MDQIVDFNEDEPLNQWIVNVDNDAKKLEQTSSMPSIYKVPSYVAIINEKAYVPHAVSFGPYHHGKKQLQLMETHKRRALWELYKELCRTLKDSYDSLGHEWQCNSRFLKLMILDGCFMLESLRTATQSHRNSMDYPPNDPIFSSHGRLHILPYIRRDMLMLENQLPMLALEMLHAAGSSQPQGENLYQLIMKFWFPEMAYASEMGRFLHILDAYRKCLLRRPASMKAAAAPSTEILQKKMEIIRSATELNEAGIKFKPAESFFLNEITFRKGVLTLPKIVIDDTTESELLNLIAFERLHVGEETGGEVAAYVFFMDNIIDSEKDVSLLHSKGIIENAMGSDKAVAKLFNTISRDLTLDPQSRLGNVHKQVKQYSKRDWNVWRANLVHRYFTNPWASLSFAAAIFLFALTILQTIYTVYPAYR
ncbi:Protein of unknown function DUF247, plant, partial [Dillenia turbinata]